MLRFNSRGTGSTFGINRFLISDCLQSMCTVKTNSFYLYTVLSASFSTPVLNYPPLRLSTLFIRSVICWTGSPNVGLLYPLKSRRAVGVRKGDGAANGAQYHLYTKSGANSNRSSYLSQIVPTTADLSSMFNLQCLFMVFFFTFLFKQSKPECIFDCQVLWFGVFYTFDMNLTHVYNNF